MLSHWGLGLQQHLNLGEDTNSQPVTERMIKYAYIQIYLTMEFHFQNTVTIYSEKYAMYYMISFGVRKIFDNTNLGFFNYERRQKSNICWVQLCSIHFIFNFEDMV